MTRPRATIEPPELTISSDKVCYIVVKAREFDVKDAPSLHDPGSNAMDDHMVDVLEDHPDDPVLEELRAVISTLSEDEQVDLITLAWLGRGDGDLGDWETLRVQAAESRPEGPTWRYLLGLPLLADYLQEGLEAFGMGRQDMELDRL